MTVKELLANVGGVKTVGIYDKNGDYFETEVTPLTVIKYLDDEIVKTNFWVYDEHRKTYDGKDYVAHDIKLNIYINRVKEKDSD